MVFELIKVLFIWTLFIGLIYYLGKSAIEYFIGIGYSNDQIFSGFIILLAAAFSYNILAKK